MPLLQCPGCDYTTQAVKQFGRHMFVHRNDANFTFACPFDACDRQHRTVAGFQTHVTREHSKRKAAIPNGPPCAVTKMDTKYQCNVPLCGKEIDGYLELMKHITEHLDKREKVQCPYKGCSGACSTAASFRAHRSRWHNDKRDQVIKQDYLNQVEINDIPRVTVAANELTNEVADNSDVEAIEDPLDDSFGPEENDLIAPSLAKFYMKLESKMNIPASTVQTIVDEVTACSDMARDLLQNKMRKVLHSHAVPEDDIANIMNEISTETGIARNNRLHFSTNALRKSYYRDRFNYVQAKEITLGFNETGNRCHLHYVPVTESLKVILTAADYANAVNNKERARIGCFQDIDDGSVFKSKQYEPNSVQLILYQDAFEVANPLGSARGVHKILAVYFTIANLPPHHRSKIDNLQLALLSKNSHIKDFGFASVLNPLVDELVDLEKNGLVIDGQLRKVYVTCIAGDSLGAHQLIGMTESFSSGHVCRFCATTLDQIRECAYVEVNERTPESYAADVRRAPMTDNGISNGVKENSVFSRLSTFRVMDPGLPPCLAHDLFEGIVPLDVFLCLDYFVKQGAFSFQEVNRRLQKFKYKSADRGSVPKPVNVRGKKLGGQAMEIYAFIRFLPLIVGLHLDEEHRDDEVWQMLMVLHEIVMLVMAPTITVEQVASLHTAVREYLCMRHQLFPDVRTKPKHHYLSHYANMILKLGPLVRLWTMRFESKHSYFKRVMRKCKNTKNVTHTLAEHHQILQAYRHTGKVFTDTIIMKNEFDFHPATYSVAIQAAYEETLGRRINGTVSSEVEVKGTRYAAGMCVLLKVEMNTVETVGKILIVLRHGEVLHLICQTYHVWRVPDNMMYQLSQTQSRVVCVNIKDLADPWPLELYNDLNTNYITLKHMPQYKELQ